MQLVSSRILLRRRRLQEPAGIFCPLPIVGVRCAQAAGACMARYVAEFQL